MPALTHGRVINGFNQYARSITYARSNCNREDNTKCGNQKPFCCGKPLQPFKYQPGSYCGSGFCRIPTGSCSRKRASATGVIGRSTTAKRAIYRRVANCQGRKSVKKTTNITCSCSKPSCRRCPSYGRRFTPLQSFQTPVQFPQKLTSSKPVASAAGAAASGTLSGAPSWSDPLSGCGYYDISGNTFTIDKKCTLDNIILFIEGTLQVNDTFTLNKNSNITIDGTLVIDASANLINADSTIFHNGTVKIDGTMKNKGIFYNYKKIEITKDGRLENRSTIDPGLFVAGAQRINNNGTIYNTGIITNEGIIDCSGGTIDCSGGTWSGNCPTKCKGALGNDICYNSTCTPPPE